MKILLVGYGKMGQAIERIAVGRGHTIAGRVDVQTSDVIAPGADVAIEFTQPGAAVNNITKCLSFGIPVVSGTTGWMEKLDEVKSVCSKHNGAFFYASNYSLGVNIFFKVNEYLARLMAGQEAYEVSVDETHHTQKKDAPSGTAITIAEGIIKNSPHKKSWVNGASEQKDQLVISSFRIDPAPGTHIVKYKSAIDDIEITHTAHSREGFALGAVLVAEWIKGRKGCFTMDDFLPF
ncbi:MAG TPA: 4-hydroxy-tetrahydrodipicolinate reductase [Cyclobacteriaceae bacterium]|nr:4-hydroxy-tetrahydrodipicolinate reductase [Cyclobacteriaceae bacterium]